MFWGERHRCGGTSSVHSASIADALYDPDPAVRRRAARELSGRARRNLLKSFAGWPALSPAAANAWLLLVTTKPPRWREPLLLWPESPPTFGTPHEGFYYPDPQGFWAEVRRWVTILVRRCEPGAATADALAVAALVHLAEEPARLPLALDHCRPRVLLVLDEAAWDASGFDRPEERTAIPDPHRAGVVYEGWWTSTSDGLIVGKSPQHPAAHQLYRSGDMEAFLGSAPLR